MPWSRKHAKALEESDIWHCMDAGAGDRHGQYVGSLPRRSLSINIREERRCTTPLPFGGSSPRAAEGNEGAGHNEENDMEESIEVVENLLESYFMQIDSSYDRLVSVGVVICLTHPPPRCRSCAALSARL